VRSALVAIRKGPSRCAKLGPIRNSRLRACPETDPVAGDRICFRADGVRDV